MYRLYEKNEMRFALIWIGIYVVAFSLAENLSAYLGIEKIISAPVSAVFAGMIFAFVTRHGLREKYGLCAFQGDPGAYLYFLPLILMMSVNLWQGVSMNYPPGETALHISTMLCVGLIEEVIFRGFLFRALCRDSVRQGIVIASVTFGMGHLVNLANGKDILPTLLQMGYATTVGFLFTVLFYRGKSLIPCIVAHSFINASSVFSGAEASLRLKVISSLFLCVISLGYALWILRKTGSVRDGGEEIGKTCVERKAGETDDQDTLRGGAGDISES